MSYINRVNRRDFIFITSAFMTFPLARLQAQPLAESGTIAQNAYIWGFPLVLTSRYRNLTANYPINQLTVSTRLSVPQDTIGTPNVDTLYGFGFLDLANEPVILHVPDTKNRYYSIQLIDAYQNSFVYVGRRSTGTLEGEFAITAPGWKGNLPNGVTKIESPTRHALALARTLVRNESDLAEASALQQQYTLRPLSAFAQAGTAPHKVDAAFNALTFVNLFESGAKVFDELNAALSIDPPSSHEKAPFKEFAKIGIGPNKQHAGAGLPADTLEDAAATASRTIRDADFSTNVNGWKVNYRVTNFIEDPLLRASVTRIGPISHVAQEALYFNVKADRDGRLLTGESRYRLHFPDGGLPPVNAFWSLTLYGANAGLVPNAIRRYCLTDRNEELVRNDDGSLDLHIQEQQPENGITNWLPAPHGPFSLILRAYQPRPELLDGRYKLPPVERL
jgi:hypothetical protein